jgi:hypothetical protein
MPTNKQDNNMGNKDKDKYSNQSSNQNSPQDSHKHLRDKDEKLDKERKSSPGASTDDADKSGSRSNR